MYKTRDKVVDTKGDSLTCINAVNKNDIQSWKLNKWLAIIKNLLNSLDHYSTSHTYREANRVADRL